MSLFYIEYINIKKLFNIINYKIYAISQNIIYEQKGPNIPTSNTKLWKKKKIQKSVAHSTTVPQLTVLFYKIFYYVRVMSRYARSSAPYTMADELRSCVGRSLRFNRHVVKWFMIRAVCENIKEKYRSFVLFSLLY